MTKYTRNMVDALGGPTVVARATGVHRTTVYQWWAGNADQVPLKYHPDLIAFARGKNVRVRQHPVYGLALRGDVK